MYTQSPFEALKITCARSRGSHVHTSEPQDHMYTQASSSDDDHMFTQRSHVHTTTLRLALNVRRATKPLSPFYFFIYTCPAPAFHQTIVSILLLYLNFPLLRSTKPVSILLLYLNFPSCVPPSHDLHSTSLFKFAPPAFHQTSLHSTSLSKLPLLRSAKP